MPLTLPPPSPPLVDCRVMGHGLRNTHLMCFARWHAWAASSGSPRSRARPLLGGRPRSVPGATFRIVVACRILARTIVLRVFLYTRRTPVCLPACPPARPPLRPTVALVRFCLDPPDRMPQPHTNTLNLDTGKASRASLLPLPPKEGLDFPQLRRSLVGRKNRFGYVTGFDWEGLPSAVVKLDLQARGS